MSCGFLCNEMASGVSILRKVDKADALQIVWESSGKLCSLESKSETNYSQREKFEYEPEKIQDVEIDYKTIKISDLRV